MTEDGICICGHFKQDHIYYPQDREGCKCSIEGCDCKHFIQSIVDNSCNCGHLKRNHALNGTCMTYNCNCIKYRPSEDVEIGNQPKLPADSGKDKIDYLCECGHIKKHHMNHSIITPAGACMISHCRCTHYKASDNIATSAVEMDDERKLSSARLPVDSGKNISYKKSIPVDRGRDTNMGCPVSIEHSILDGKDFMIFKEHDGNEIMRLEKKFWDCHSDAEKYIYVKFAMRFCG